MTVPRYAIYGISFSDSNSASEFSECIGRPLIVHYYVKNRKREINSSSLVNTVQHTFNTYTQYVWTVLFSENFPLSSL